MNSGDCSTRTVVGWYVVPGFRRLFQLPALLPEFPKGGSSVRSAATAASDRVVLMMDGAERHSSLTFRLNPLRYACRR
jgi:hypothetical protein